jgi:ribosomal protein S18 acetylase RimI-like enzyme
MLFAHALNGSTAAERGLDAGERDIVLDVLVSNPRAAALYRRLGFVALSCRRPRSRFLPAQLESLRKRLAARPKV